MIRLNLKKAFILLICFLIISSTVFFLYKFNMKYISDEKYMPYRVMVVEKIKQEESVLSYIVKLNNDKFILNIYKDQYNNQNSNLIKYANYKYGDELILQGKIVIPELLNNPYEFDYKRYLNSKNIYGIINTYSTLQHEKNTGNYIIKQIYLLREYIYSKIEQNCTKDNADTLKAIIYGEKENLAQEIKDNFKNIGLSHMLVASGANIALILLIITRICKKLHISKYITNIFLIINILLFIVVCGLEPSITRAGIMTTITLLLKFKNKKISTYKKLLISFVIMYILNPMQIYSTSFQLSFLATFSIILFYKKIYLMLKHHIKRKINKSIFFLLKHPLKLFSLMLSVQIGILPIQINTFNCYLPISFLSNIVIGIMISFIKVAGIISAYLSFSPLCNLLLKLLDPFIAILLKVIKVFNQTSYSINLASLPTHIILIYYVYIILIFLHDNLIIKDFQLSILFRKVFYKLKRLFILLLLLSLIINKVYNIFFDNYIMFFNVGQGEMSMISYKNKNIIIDMGSTYKSLSQNILLNYLKKKNISNIDLLIVSHFDSDHVNGIIDLINNVCVGNIIYAKPAKESKLYNDIIKNINQKNVNQIIVETGDTFNILDMQIKILHPARERTSNDENSNSIVCIVKTNNKKVLYTGDATIEVERILLKNNMIEKVDILKVGHHGSKTSTCEEFIKKTNPLIAIISSKKKVFGHPNEIVLEILKKYKIKIYITEKNGAIKIII